MFNLNETIGQIAASHPASTHVFLRHRLDFCCGGRQKFGDACRSAGLDPAQVTLEIARAEAWSPAEKWDEKPLSELIAFIVEHYHEPLRADLPALIDAALRVEKVHATKPSCPRGLAAHLSQFEAAIQQHLAKEEQVLFPAIVSGSRGAGVHMPIRVMMEEHDDHGQELRRLRELTDDFRPPVEACVTWKALYLALEKLEAELMEHIHLENNILFPRALGG